MGLGESVIVPSAKLAAFAASAVRDPAGPLGPDGTFDVIPPGDRPLSVGVWFVKARPGES